MTARAYTDIAQKSLGSTFRNVSNEYTLSHVTIKDVFMEFVREHRQKLRFRTPAFLGIDEIKIKKIGEVTVITDLEHRTLYDMLKGRNQAALTEYFKKMPDREKVLWVCSDMYRPFERSIGQALPNARFHLRFRSRERGRIRTVEICFVERAARDEETAERYAGDYFVFHGCNALKFEFESDRNDLYLRIVVR